MRWYERRRRFGQRGPFFYELTLRSKHPITGALLTVRQLVPVVEVRRAKFHLLKAYREQMIRKMLAEEQSRRTPEAP